MCPTDLQAPVVIAYAVARDGDRFVVKEFASGSNRMVVRTLEALETMDLALTKARCLALHNKVAFIGVEKGPADQQTA